MPDSISLNRELPIGSEGHNALGWAGMWMLIATEAALFAYLIFSDIYLAGQVHGRWVPETPKLRLALPNTVLLIASSFVLYWGERGIRTGNRTRLLAGLAVTFLMGAAFAIVQLDEWSNKHFTLAASAYASEYFVTTGFHLAHVLGGLLILATLFAWTWMDKFDARRHAAVSIGALYWHFVDAVWIAVFSTFYLAPYLTRS
ncbi:heme-copper oxidase subunit III [Oxalobacteraceae bacterium OM1]|nr:heme-copper oxidase subunit III [Oxalobacteraceae bacterium OM1]